METKFKVGDKVRYLGTKCGEVSENWQEYFADKGIKKGSEGVISAVYPDGDVFVHEDGRNTTSGYLKACDLELIKFPKNPLKSMKMDTEKLKTFNPKNLLEGKKQAEEEKANYEAKESKKIYLELIDSKEELQREIKVKQTELKEVNKELKIFK